MEYEEERSRIIEKFRTKNSENASSASGSTSNVPLQSHKIGYVENKSVLFGNLQDDERTHQQFRSLVSNQTEFRFSKENEELNRQIIGHQNQQLRDRLNEKDEEEKSINDSKEIEELNRQIKELKNQNEQLRNCLNEKNDEEKSTNEKLNALQEELTEVTNKNRESESVIHELKIKGAKQSNEVNELERCLKALTIESETRKDELQFCVDKVNEEREYLLSKFEAYKQFTTELLDGYDRNKERVFEVLRLADDECSDEH